MIRSPVRRSAEDADHAEPTSGAGSRVDAWIAAAIQKEAADLPAPPPPSEADRGTATALGSFASWIEQTQKDLAESAQATMRAQEEATAVIKGTVGTLEERLKSVEQQVGQGSVAATTPAPAPQPATRSPDAPAARRHGGSEFDASLRSFETRLGQLTQRVAAPYPEGRRIFNHADEVRSAVAEIRSHQARLDAAPVRPERRTLPALGTLARSQTALLTSLRADIASLATRLDTRAPLLPAPEAESLPGLAASAVTRDDLGRLEEGIRTLTADLAELRSATGAAAGAPETRTLHDDIRRMAEQAFAPGGSPTARELETLSNKLDIVAASGVDPSAIETLTRQVADVRQILVETATPASGVETQLAELRREFAAFGERQIDPRAVTTLAASLDEVRAALASGHPVQASGHDIAARAVRDIGQPIETMLSALVDRLERIEQRMTDPESLNHLELQISDLTARMSAAPTDDPTISSLDRSVTALMEEVSGWREGTVRVAEQAARNAVAEMAGAHPLATSLDQQLAAIRDHYEATGIRAGESLASVQSMLGEVMGRLVQLETKPAEAPESQGSTPGETPSPRPPSRPAGSAPVVAEQPAMPATGPAPEDEILLEPGSARPRRPAIDNPGPVPAIDAQDIKANFIAAARRAAQTAAAESASTRKAGASADKAGRSILSPSELAARVRQMIETRRRPLLLSVAAVVLALGSLHIARTAMTDAPAPGAAAESRPAAAPPQILAAPKPSAPSPVPAAPKAPEAAADPATTQSLADRSEAPGDGERSGPIPSVAAAPAVPAAREEAARSVRPDAKEPVRTAAIPVPPTLAQTPLSPPRPSPEQAAPVSAGLRQAAATGNAVALYELAVRTAEGRGVPRDLKGAAILFEKAAEKNLVPAQYRTGNVYEKGVGVARNVDSAKAWYRRAAESGNVRAMHNLAVLIAEGGGGKPDYAAALALFTKAAEHGVRDSQFNLAVLYARGLGTAQDLSKTYYWLAIAASQGDEDAGRKRDEVGSRLSAADLATLKSSVERWKPGVANPAANEVQFPAAWPEASPPKRTPAKEARV